MMSKTKAISRKEQLDLINKMKSKIKDHDVVKQMFKDYDADVSDIDLIPICFKDLDVSARTERGCVYLNNSLLEDDDLFANDHYLVHELTHALQQAYGDKPTKSSDSGDYLGNKYEQEGFQNQTEYMADTKGEDVAEDYVENLLDHHDVFDKKKREKRKDQLLNIARQNFEKRLKHGV